MRINSPETIKMFASGPTLDEYDREIAPFWSARAEAMIDDPIAQRWQPRDHMQRLTRYQPGVSQTILENLLPQESTQLNITAQQQGLTPLQAIEQQPELIYDSQYFQKSLNDRKQHDIEAAQRWHAQSILEDPDSPVYNTLASVAGTLSTPTEIALLATGIALGGAAVPKLLSIVPKFGSYYKKVATVKKTSTITGQSVVAGTARAPKLLKQLEVGFYNAATEAAAIGAAEYSAGLARKQSMMDRGVSEEEATQAAFGDWILPLTIGFGVARFGLSTILDRRLQKKLGDVDLMDIREFNSDVNKILRNHPDGPVAALAGIKKSFGKETLLTNAERFKKENADLLVPIKEGQLKKDFAPDGTPIPARLEKTLHSRKSFDAWVDDLVNSTLPANATAKEIAETTAQVLATQKRNLKVTNMGDVYVEFDEEALSKNYRGLKHLFDIENPLIAMADPAQYKQLRNTFVNLRGELIGVTEQGGSRVWTKIDAEGKILLDPEVTDKFTPQFADMVKDLGSADEFAVRAKLIKEVALNPALEKEAREFFPQVTDYVKVAPADREAFETFSQAAKYESDYLYWNAFTDKAEAANAIEAAQLAGINKPREIFNTAKILTKSPENGPKLLENIGDLLALDSKLVSELSPGIRHTITQIRTAKPDEVIKIIDALVYDSGEQAGEAAAEGAKKTPKPKSLYDELLGTDKFRGSGGNWHAQAKITKVTDKSIMVDIDGKAHRVPLQPGIKVKTHKKVLTDGKKPVTITGHKYTMEMNGVKVTLPPKQAAQALLETLYGSITPIAKDSNRITLNGKATTLGETDEFTNRLTGEVLHTKRNDNGTYDIMQKGGTMRENNLTVKQVQARLHHSQESFLEKEAIDRFEICSRGFL